jgi:hypothetical protein
MEVISGDFHVDVNIFDGDGVGLEDATLEFKFDGLAVVLDIENKLSAVQDVPIDLFSIPLAGFAIPGLTNVGLTASPTIVFDVDIDTPGTATYGFEAKIPDDSNVFINFLDPSQNHVNGFDKSTVDAFPLSIDTEPGKLGIGLSFRPKLELGFDILEFGGGDASAAISIPQINIDLEEMENANAQCTPLPDTKAQMSPAQSFAAEALGALHRVEKSVQVNFKLSAGLHPGPSVETAFPGPKTALPTECLSYDKGKSDFIPATKVLSVASSRSSVASSRSSVASSRSSVSEARASRSSAAASRSSATAALITATGQQTSVGQKGITEGPSTGAAARIDLPAFSRRGNLVEDMAMWLVFVAGFFVAI